MSSNILHIDSSLFGEGGVSHKLAKHLITHISDAGTKYVHRNLAAQPLAHFDASTMQAVAEGQAHIADDLIAEAQAADVIVIGAPMYNFGIPSQLKSWLDYIARAGVTFRYTENGPEGLLKGKKVYVVTTRGGQYKDTAKDTLVPYLKTMMGFLGLDEQLEFIYAEQLARTESKENSIAQAIQYIDDLVSEEETV